MPVKNSKNIAPARFTRKDLAEIYEELSPRLYNYAVRLLGDPQAAEDCVAETFSRFLNTVKNRIGPKDNFRAYLYKISYHWIMDYYRHGFPEICNGEINEFPGSLGNPESTLTVKVEKQKIRKALLKLPEDQLRVIMLRFFDELSHEETASIMGRSIEATRALQYRAVKRLRRQLVAGNK